MRCGILAGALLGLWPGWAHSELVINEALPAPHADWSANGIRGETSDEWIEIANLGTEEADLGGHFLASPHTPEVPRTGLEGSIEPGRWRLVTGEHALDWQRERGLPAEGLQLADGGDEVALFQTTSEGAQFVDGLAWDSVPADVALGRLPDGNGAVIAFDALTEGGAGVQPTPGGENGGVAAPKILEALCEPTAPSSADAVTVRAVAADSDGIAQATLVLRVDGGPAQLLAMTLVDGTPEWGIWEHVLAPHVANTRLDWKVRISDGGWLAETNEVTLRVADSVVPGVWLNEILADPPPDPNGDANGDGVRSSGDDEFIEIINRSAGPMDLSNWALADSGAVRHVFPAGFVLGAGELYVVFGGGTPAGIPSASAVASEGTLSLNNTSDQVRLLDDLGAVRDSRPYGAEANADQSLIRIPDGDGPWTRPLDAGFAWRYSPGLLNAAPSPVEATSWAHIKALFQH